MKAKSLLFVAALATFASCNRENTSPAPEAEVQTMDFGKELISSLKFPLPEFFGDTASAELLKESDANFDRRKFINTLLLEVLSGKLKAYDSQYANAKQLTANEIKIKCGFGEATDTLITIDPNSGKETITVQTKQLGLDTLISLDPKTNQEDTTYQISESALDRFHQIRFVEAITYDPASRSMTKNVAAVGLGRKFLDSNGTYIGDAYVFIRF
jgi:hypothetical protein